MTVDEEWTEQTLSLASDPHSFAHWETLLEHVAQGLSKASPPEHLARFRASFDQFLGIFPLMEAYWVRYAQLEWRLGQTDRCLAVYRRGLSLLPFSNLVWLHYLELVQLVQLDYTRVIQAYAEAEMRIGTHYHGYEFWKQYLNVEESHRGKTVYWYNLLKKVVEVPLYNYAYFYQLLLAEIDQLGPSMILLIVSESDLQRKLKVDVQDLDLKRLNYRDLKAKLKKQYTDAYITTQFKSYELYQYEQGVKLEFYAPDLYKSYQELSNWDEYLNYMEINGKPQQVEQLYHRALVPTAQYPNLWLKFADYYIHKGQVSNAKHLLYKSLVVLRDENLTPVQLKLIKLELQLKQYLKARDLALAALSQSGDNVELLLQLVNIERLINPEFPVFVTRLIQGLADNAVAVQILREVCTFMELEMSAFENKLQGEPRYWALVLTAMLEHESLEAVKAEYQRASGFADLRQWHSSFLATSEPVPFLAGSKALFSRAS